MIDETPEFATEKVQTGFSLLEALILQTASPDHDIELEGFNFPDGDSESDEADKGDTSMAAASSAVYPGTATPMAGEEKEMKAVSPPAATTAPKSVASHINDNKEGPKLTGAALKKAKRAMRRKVLPHLQEKRKERSHQRRERRVVNTLTEPAIEDYPIAKGGRSGRPQMEEVIKALPYDDADRMREILQNFDQLPQPENSQTPTSVLSAEGRRVVFRSFRSKKTTEEFLSEFSTKLSEFSKAVNLQHSSHPRGEYGYFNFGIQHGYGNHGDMPGRVNEHGSHQEAADALLNSPEFQMLIQEASQLTQEWFPSLAQRAKECEEHWRNFSGNRDLKMEFGLWWVATINFPTKGSVKTRLHRDGKNVAAGVCAIWVFGDFDEDNECWLVCWELNLIIQVRCGCWIFIPSALITHGNVDKKEFSFDFVVAEKNERPTPSNSRPFKGTRGSVVFYSPATFYSVMGHDYSTLAAARRAGVPAADLDLAKSEVAKYFPLVPQ